MDFDERIAKLKEIVSEGHIVFFGGAGVSTGSGMKDFRSKDGLYNEKNEFKWPPESILSHDFFFKRPQIFYEFYRKKMNILPYEPNIVHKTVAEWEKQGLLDVVITQNIDNLHQKAGSSNVIELHGTAMNNYCTNKNCSEPYDVNDVFYGNDEYPVCKKCGRIVRPDIVLFGEQLDSEKLSNSVKYLNKAKTCIVCGCSMSVYPAAGLISEFYGDNLVVINKDKVPNENWCQLVFHEDMIDVFKALQL